MLATKRYFEVIGMRSSSLSIQRVRRRGERLTEQLMHRHITPAAISQERYVCAGGVEAVGQSRPVAQYGYGIGPQGTSISVGALMPIASLSLASSSSALCALAPRAP